MKKILIIEQDKIIAEMYKKMLSQRFSVLICGSAQDAIDALDSSEIDLVVTDFYLGKHNGVELLHEIRSYRDWMEIPLIFLNSSTSLSTDHVKDWSRYNVAEIINISEVNSQEFLKVISKHSGYYESE